MTEILTLVHLKKENRQLTFTLRFDIANYLFFEEQTSTTALKSRSHLHS